MLIQLSGPVAAKTENSGGGADIVSFHTVETTASFDHGAITAPWSEEKL